MGAIEYVDTVLGTGDNDGTTWANAWRTPGTALNSALASCDAGGTIYVKSDSVPLYAANVTLGSTNGVASNPVTIISVKEGAAEPPGAGDYETMMAGGGLVDADDGAYDILFSGWDIWIGFHFVIGDDLRIVTLSVSLVFINCKFTIEDLFEIDSHGDCGFFLYNCDVIHTGSGYIWISGQFEWHGGTYAWEGAGSISGYFLNLSTSRGCNVVVAGVDIQDLDASDFLVSDSDSSHDILFKRCKIPAVVNYMNAGPSGPPCKVRFHSVDDGNNIYTFKEYYFEGRIESDTAIYRSATYDGTNEYSAKMTADKGNTVNWSRPLRFKLAEIWCDANPTLTIHFNLDQAAVIQNNELWFEVEYPDVTIGALGIIDQSSRPANILTAAEDQGSSEGDPGGWTEAFVNPQARSTEISIANGQAGIHTIWVCLAKEATVYVCPKIVVT